MALRTILFVAATLLNIGLNTGASAAEQAPRPERQQPAPKPLDLRPPALLRIATLEQIDAVLSRAVDPNLERVEVEAPRLHDLPLVDRSDPAVQTVFKSVARWVTPSTLYASRVNYAPNTDAYRPVPVALSSYSPNFPPPHAQR